MTVHRRKAGAKAGRTEGSKYKYRADSCFPRDCRTALLICWQHLEKTQCLGKVPFPPAVPTGAARSDPLGLSFVWLQ